MIYYKMISSTIIYQIIDQTSYFKVAMYKLLNSRILTSFRIVIMTLSYNFYFFCLLKSLLIL